MRPHIGGPSQIAKRPTPSIASNHEAKSTDPSNEHASASLTARPLSMRDQVQGRSLRLIMHAHAAHPHSYPDPAVADISRATYCNGASMHLYWRLYLTLWHGTLHVSSARPGKDRPSSSIPFDVPNWPFRPFHLPFVFGHPPPPSPIVLGQRFFPSLRYTHY